MPGGVIGSVGCWVVVVVAVVEVPVVVPGVAVLVPDVVVPEVEEAPAVGLLLSLLPVAGVELLFPVELFPGATGPPGDVGVVVLVPPAAVPGLLKHTLPPEHIKEAALSRTMIFFGFIRLSWLKILESSAFFHWAALAAFQLACRVPYQKT